MMVEATMAGETGVPRTFQEETTIGRRGIENLFPWKVNFNFDLTDQFNSPVDSWPLLLLKWPLLLCFFFLIQQQQK